MRANQKPKKQWQYEPLVGNFIGINFKGGSSASRIRLRAPSDEAHVLRRQCYRGKCSHKDYLGREVPRNEPHAFTLFGAF
jgi:hypothetical protein